MYGKIKDTIDNVNYLYRLCFGEKFFIMNIYFSIEMKYSFFRIAYLETKQLNLFHADILLQKKRFQIKKSQRKYFKSISLTKQRMKNKQ